MEENPNAPRGGRPFGGAPPEKEERRGAGAALPGAALPAFGGLFAFLGAYKLAAGLLALAALGGLGARVALDRREKERLSPKTPSETSARPAASPFASGPRGDQSPPSYGGYAASPDTRPESRRSSLDFAGAKETSNGYLGMPSGAPPADAGAGSSGRDSAAGASSPSASARAASRRPEGESAPRLSSRLGDQRGFSTSIKGGFDIFSRRNKSLTKNSASRGIGDARAGRGSSGMEPAMHAHLAAVRSKLSGKDLGSRVSSSKAMGQLKFADSRSRRAGKGKTASAMAAYGKQAFAQVSGDADDIEPEEPGAGEGGPDGGGAGGPSIDPGAYSVQQGQYVRENSGGGQCPPGMSGVEGGGCRPADTGGDDATTYDGLVRKAWDYIKRARKAAQKLDLKTASKLSEKAETLGLRVGSEYGQSMQGEIIKYWADRANELTHYDKAEKRAQEKKSRQMDPKLQDDVTRALAEERDSGYRE